MRGNQERASVHFMPTRLRVCVIRVGLLNDTPVEVEHTHTCVGTARVIRIPLAGRHCTVTCDIGWAGWCNIRERMVERSVIFSGLLSGAIRRLMLVRKL